MRLYKTIDISYDTVSRADSHVLPFRTQIGRETIPLRIHKYHYSILYNKMLSKNTFLKILVKNKVLHKNYLQ